MDAGTIHEQDILGSLWRLISGTLPTITSNAGLSNLQTASNKEPLSISDSLFLKVLLFIYSFITSINKTFFWFSVKTNQKKMCTTKNLHERKNNKEKLISQEREMVYLNAGFGQQCSFTTSAHTTIRCCYQTIQKSKYINCGLEENSRFVTSPHDRKMNSRQWLVKQRAAAKIQCFNYQLHP